MSGSVNKAIILGRLGRDPEISKMNSGDSVANLSIATSETWKDKKTGEKREKSEWHRVVIWGPLAEIAERYLSKGSQVYLEGQIETRKWQDQSGQEKYSTEIVLRGPRAVMNLLGGQQGGGSSGGGGYSEPNPDAPREDFRNADMDDEIPFASCVGIW